MSSTVREDTVHQDFGKSTGHLLQNTVYDSFHVVLVEPGISANIGSVARAMKNLGFSHLHLVSPPRLDQKKARATACWGKDILDGAFYHDTLDQALSSMQQVIGFTARQGRNRAPTLLLPDWAEKLKETELKRTALLFGPEDTGLTTEHLEHCTSLVRIPSVAENPAFNLAQAVLLGLFEVTRVDFSQVSKQVSDKATRNEFFHLDRLVEEVLRSSRFIRPGSPETIPRVIKNLFRRAEPDKREVGILLAMFNRIQTGLERQRCSQERDVIKPGQDTGPIEES